jgi:hypothetical protein
VYLKDGNDFEWNSTSECVTGCLDGVYCLVILGVGMVQQVNDAVTVAVFIVIP